MTYNELHWGTFQGQTHADGQEAELTGRESKCYVLFFPQPFTLP